MMNFLLLPEKWCFFFGWTENWILMYVCVYAHEFLCLRMLNLIRMKWMKKVDFNIGLVLPKFHFVWIINNVIIFYAFISFRLRIVDLFSFACLKLVKFFLGAIIKCYYLFEWIITECVYLVLTQCIRDNRQFFLVKCEK